MHELNCKTNIMLVRQEEKQYEQSVYVINNINNTSKLCITHLSRNVEKNENK